MTTLTLMVADEIAPEYLAAMIEAVHPHAPFDYIIADWWDAPGLFTDYTTGLAELKVKAGDCVGGSAFGETAEVCWRSINDKFRMTLVAERDMSGLLKQNNGVNGAKWDADDEVKKEIERIKQSEDGSDVFQVILWGTECIAEPTAGSSVWIEARIPRPLSYPVKPEPIKKEGQDKFDGVLLKVKEYYDARGRPVIYRRCGLKAQIIEREHEDQERAEEEEGETGLTEKERAVTIDS